MCLTWYFTLKTLQLDCKIQYACNVLAQLQPDNMVLEMQAEIEAQDAVLQLI